MPKIKVQDHTAKTSMAIAVGMHVIAFALVAWFFRSEIQEMTSKIIQVVMPDKDKKPKPKEEKKEDLAKENKAETPNIKDLPKIQSSAPAPAPSGPASTANNGPAIVAAPAAAGGDAGWFSEGAKVVETVNDPIVLYQHQIERAFHLNWLKPDDIDDSQFVAEAEVEIGQGGRIVRSALLTGSGNQKWDDSVRKVLTATASVRVDPPKGFPPKIRVRFDVTADESQPLDNLIQ